MTPRALAAARVLVVPVHLSVGTGPVAGNLAPLRCTRRSVIRLEHSMDVVRPILPEASGIGGLRGSGGSCKADNAKSYRQSCNSAHVIPQLKRLPSAAINGLKLSQIAAGALTTSNAAHRLPDDRRDLSEVTVIERSDKATDALRKYMLMLANRVPRRFCRRFALAFGLTRTV